MLVDAIYMRIGIVVTQNCMYSGRKNTVVAQYLCKIDAN